ncbi:hypothetical protein TNCV_5015391 [Trichonephila clavipes]|nr:hypothetical protein TNCV_5015391 [Trichonephila clavipes]
MSHSMFKLSYTTPTTVDWDSLWFINVNEQSIKKEMGSLSDETETDQAMEHDEIRNINHDFESRFEISELLR